ncbi:MAG: hypothetical protein ABI625_18350 [bacterium]
MIRKLCGPVVVALFVLGIACNAPIAPDARLSIALEPTSVSVALGAERSAVVTLTRFGDFSGDVAFSVEGTPPGVTATVTSVSTSGQTTTATVLLRADAGAKVGTFPMTIRGHAALLRDATSLLVLTITDPASFTLAASKPTLTITRGGLAPLSAIITRTNFTGPVALSLEAQQGITADLGQSPATIDSIPFTVSVAPSVGPGTYTVSLRGAAAGLTDRLASFTVTVIADPIQLIALSNVSGFQRSAGTANIVVNRGGYSGAITLTAEGLPTGVSASFQTVASSSGVTTVTLTTGPSAPPGVYTVTIRATGTGVPDATAQVTLTVLSTVFALSLNPQSVSLLQGTSATAVLTVTRTTIDKPVALSVENVPPGLTITPSPVSTSGTSSTISITAASTLAVGQYDITIRGTPEGLTLGASLTATLAVTIRATAPGVGNVLLDWTACTSPSWVAAQDGAGPWTQVTGASGLFRFDVNAGTGGFAFAEGGNSISVRYMTRAELTAKTIDMCASALGPKTIIGTAVHSNIAEQSVYRLGGGSGASSGAAPGFSITGVRNGVHDLLVWGPAFPIIQRGLIRRDVDLPNGGSLGSVNLNGIEGFTPPQRVLTLTGFGANEQFAFTVSYLTTAACTVNQLYSANAGAFMYGVPDTLQRSNDFHMVTALAITVTGSRAASEVFHTMANRTVAFAPALIYPAVVALPGSYKRLQVAAGSMPGPYNGAVALRYSDGVRTMSVSTTMGAANTSPIVLAMPDLSGVSGWPSSYAVSSSATGTWVESADGVSASGSLCTEGMRSITASRSGSF